jgi:hypothetical protein
MKKAFTKTLRADLKVNRTRGRVEVSGSGLSYRIASRDADRAMAETLNSRIPVNPLRP